ncbi:hypothetical protein JCM10450v2_000840 [Rhodotorula kratochvilovae]
MRLADAPSSRLATLPAPLVEPPLFPPPAQPAPHARLAYARESSLSPARAASQRRFSHSRGRPRIGAGAGGGGSAERSASRGGGSDWSGDAGWRERSESRDGSRAPLWRGALFSSAARGASTEKAAAVGEEEKPDLGLKEDNKGLWVVRLGRHFCGIRDRRTLATPLVRPLRHLSPTTEGYLLAFLGSFPSILIACGLSLGLSSLPSSAFAATPLTVGSLGATAVLLYAIPEGPLSQPRNLVGGHLVSALTGAIISQLFALSSRFDTSEASDNTLASGDSWGSLTPVAAALAVSLAIFTMQVTGTVHPPGASSNWFVIAAYHRSTAQRWTYVLDVVISVSAMGVWAMVVNNLGRRALALPPSSLPPPSTNSAEAKPKRRPSPPSHFEHAHAASGPLSPSEDLERRWLGRLGEVDEEALAGGDEPAQREEEAWREREEEEERGRRATRR